MKILEKIALVFTIIGGINWGLVGLFDFNLVTWMFGAASVFTKIIYVFIAICALINVLLLFMHIEDKPMHERHEDVHVHNVNKPTF